MSIRPLRLEDADRVAALDLACEGAAHWSAADYRSIAQESSRLCLVAEHSGAIAGLLVVGVAADQAEILNLAVHSGNRRRGIASNLLQEAMRLTGEAGAASAWLEVRESNRGAIAFYQQNGFAQRGRRRGYYSAPGEDALVMTRTLARTLARTLPLSDGQS